MLSSRYWPNQNNDIYLKYDLHFEEGFEIIQRLLYIRPNAIWGPFKLNPSAKPHEVGDDSSRQVGVWQNVYRGWNRWLYGLAEKENEENTWETEKVIIREYADRIGNTSKQSGSRNILNLLQVILFITFFKLVLSFQSTDKRITGRYRTLS